MRMFLLCVVCLISYIAHCQEIPSAVFPATVDSMMKLWAQMFEVCNSAGVPCHEVHVQDQDAENIIIKMDSRWYIPFVEACETKLDVKPLIRLDQQGGRSSSLGVFDMELAWPRDVPSSLDDELRSLLSSGVKVENKKVKVYIVPVGAIDLQVILKHMTRTQTLISNRIEGAGGTLPPTPKPAIVPNISQ